MKLTERTFYCNINMSYRGLYCLSYSVWSLNALMLSSTSYIYCSHWCRSRGSFISILSTDTRWPCSRLLIMLNLTLLTTTGTLGRHSTSPHTMQCSSSFFTIFISAYSSHDFLFLFFFFPCYTSSLTHPTLYWMLFLLLHIHVHNIPGNYADLISGNFSTTRSGLDSSDVLTS